MAMPKHVAIIMDGNGRWAKKRGLPRVVGHREGVESVRAVVKACSEIGVKYLTLFTSSTENWQRPKDEVKTLMGMLKNLITKETPELHKSKVRILFSGRISDLAPDIQEEFRKSIELTQNNTGLTLCLAISYGGRAEIVDAIKRVIMVDRQSKIDLDKVDEDWFKNFLYHPEVPDPDILIRTGCEKEPGSLTSCSGNQHMPNSISRRNFGLSSEKQNYY